MCMVGVLCDIPFSILEHSLHLYTSIYGVDLLALFSALLSLDLLCVLIACTWEQIEVFCLLGCCTNERLAMPEI